MRTFTAAITLALAALANAAAVRRSDPPTEPGLLTFRNAECSYADAQYEGDFIPFSLFSGDKCLYLALFRSVIVYTPDGGPLPYNVSIASCTDKESVLTRCADFRRQLFEWAVRRHHEGGQAQHDKHMHQVDGRQRAQRVRIPLEGVIWP
jgi:hypothetical protein